MDDKANGSLRDYSDEDEDNWMPFQRSAPDVADGENGWDRGGFVSPFQGTPVEKIHAIAKTLELTKEDVVYDLGCGDGRFIIECCSLTGCAGVGIDLDEGLVAKARRNAAAAGKISAEFLQGDFLDEKLDLLPATVIFVYLLPEALMLLAPRIEDLVRKSTSLRSIVSLCWPLCGVKASVSDSANRVFLYLIEDLRRQLQVDPLL